MKTDGEIEKYWGFFGTLVKEPFTLSEDEAGQLFDAAVEVLGGQPEAARQFLNSNRGRHLADQLFDEASRRIKPDESDGLGAMLAVVRGMKGDRRFRWLFREYGTFQPYEGCHDKSTVKKLLGEADNGEISIAINVNGVEMQKMVSQFRTGLDTASKVRIAARLKDAIRAVITANAQDFK